jgi:signal transduction histidine kinase
MILRMNSDRTLWLQELLVMGAVFAAWLVTAKLGQYIFFTFDTSPALIWASSGIAVAAVFLWGYRMAIPIAAAALVTTLTGSTPWPLPVIAAIVAGQTIYPVAVAFALRWFGFDPLFLRVKDVLIFVGCTFALTALAPSVIVTAQYLTDTLTTTPAIAWTRSWAGRIFSVLMIAPLIMTLYRANEPKYSTGTRLSESLGAYLALTVTLFLLFWTGLAREYTFVILYFLFLILFWISLRMHFRAMAFSFFLMAAFGMAGILLVPTDQPLNQRLFSYELFMILVAPIFYLFSALVGDRRQARNDLQGNVEELRMALAKISREDQAKSEFIAVLSHELRNPLAPVVSYLELTKAELGKEHIDRNQATQYVTTADTHVRTIVRLLDDLLDISRISRKEFNLKKEPVVCGEVVDRALETVRTFYDERKHSLTTSIPKKAIVLNADPVRMQQIIINLLYNAAKYTQPGGRVQLAVVHDRERGVRLSVKDNGIGIERDMLEQIFEPFVQQKNDIGVGTGLGIGLSLTKRLVELHAGRIWAESEGVGKGSEFVVVLPALEVPIASHEPAPRQALYSQPGIRLQEDGAGM